MIKKTQIINIRNKKGGISTDSPNFKSIREYYEQIYANTLNNFNEMDKFLKTQTTKGQSK